MEEKRVVGNFVYLFNVYGLIIYVFRFCNIIFLIIMLVFIISLNFIDYNRNVVNKEFEFVSFIEV